MASKCENGVFKEENGQWGYRFSLMIDGKRVSKRKTTDAEGQKLTSKRAAQKARAAAIAEAHLEVKRKQPISRKTVKEVFEEFCEKGRNDRAYQTIRKQDSLWENHLKSRFGKRYVDDFSSAEVVDYLSELYYIEGFSYQYTESFLKMFYLIFGQAYSRNYLDVDTYNKLCVNKDTKIHMPKIKGEDAREIKSFSHEELFLLDEYFKGTNAETAYMLGRYCGLRIGECYGLKWDNVDLEKGTILIDRQLQCENGVIKMIAPKTLNSKRTIYMNDTLKAYLSKLAKQREEDSALFKELREQKQTLLEDLGGGTVSSLDLVNTLPNGKIQTRNSMKFHSSTIKQRLGLNFKYHYLRHTFGTVMAELNTPAHLLCSQMGHGHIHTTQRYYLAISKDSVELLRNNLNQL